MVNGAARLRGMTCDQMSVFVASPIQPACAGHHKVLQMPKQQQHMGMSP
jgi:hypothetical protein